MGNKNNWLSFMLSKKNRNIMNEINKQINNKTNSLEIIDHNLIHMTCVFLGKLLQGQKKETLVSVNNIIIEYIEKLRNMNITLIFDRFEYLPFDKPNKKLLIAIYKENKNLKSWNHNFRIELKKLGVCSYTTDDFMPHFTIGKIKKLFSITELNKLSYPNININNLYLDGVKNKYILN